MHVSQKPRRVNYILSSMEFQNAIYSSVRKRRKINKNTEGNFRNSRVAQCQSFSFVEEKKEKKKEESSRYTYIGNK